MKRKMIAITKKTMLVTKIVLIKITGIIAVIKIEIIRLWCK